MSDHLLAKFLWQAGVPGYEPPLSVPEPARCGVCGEYAVSPRTGECFACLDERETP